jgi:hypothetical protein
MSQLEGTQAKSKRFHSVNVLAEGVQADCLPVLLWSEEGVHSGEHVRLGPKIRNVHLRSLGGLEQWLRKHFVHG